MKSRTSTSAPKAKSHLRHWVQTWPLVGLTHGFDMSWFQNKTGAKSESETLIGAAEQYSLLKAYGIEAVFPNVEVALRIYLSLMVSNCSGDRSFSRDSGVNCYTIICRHYFV